MYDRRNFCIVSSLRLHVCCCETSLNCVYIHRISVGMLLRRCIVLMLCVSIVQYTASIELALFLCIQYMCLSHLLLFISYVVHCSIVVSLLTVTLGPAGNFLM